MLDSTTFMTDAMLDSTTEPTMLNFTDNEYTVIYDSLVMARERLRKMNLPTPILDSTIQKLDDSVGKLVRKPH